MYNVVFRNISSQTNRGAITRTSFDDKDYFDKWYDEDMRKFFDIVAEGVTSEKAVEICSSPESNITLIFTGIRKVSLLTEEIDKLAEKISQEEIQHGQGCF